MDSLEPTDDRAPALASLERPARVGARVGAPPLSEVRRFELRLKGLCMASRMLPALTADNAFAERARLTAALERGEMPVPDWTIARQRVPPEAFRLIDELRRRADALPGAPLYRARLDELELDLMLIDALGRPRLVRPLSARRYGTGSRVAPTALGPLPLSRCARMLLDEVSPAHEPREVAADGEPGSLGAQVRALADLVGLDVQVRIEPQLAAGAAAGERTVFVAPRRFGRVEARRLAVHEVLGHLVAAANGRAQPIRLLEWGTAGSFVDQEGLALYLEHVHGLMDATRLRTLAARVIAADMMHRGASFAETARHLHDEEHFPAADAVVLAERAYRGGGVARDVGYLLGFLRVHDAISRGEASIDALRCGRVSLQALPDIDALRAQGYARSSVFRPNLTLSLRATSSGTMPRKSPPSEAASLIRLELTKK